MHVDHEASRLDCWKCELTNMQVVQSPYYVKGREKRWQIYLLQNTVMDRWYVGQTSNGLARIKNHFRKDTANAILWSDVEHYGVKAFRYRFLEMAPIYTRDRAVLAELIEIVRRDTIFPRGYNRAIETTPEMSRKTWEKLRQVSEMSRDFRDTGEMLEIPCF